MERLLGIDFGEKRIGLALSDPLGITAQPLDTIKNDPDLVNNLENIVKERTIKKIILGYPLQLNGEVGLAAEKVLKFKTSLEEKLNVEVILQDERLTSAEANKRMLEADLSRKKRKENVDKLAAILILQKYLDIA